MDLITKERGEFIKILATDEDLAKIMAKGLIKNGRPCNGCKGRFL